MRRWHLNPVMLGEFVELQARRFPQRKVFIFENEGKPDEILTYYDLHRLSNRLGRELKRRGLKPGDRFSLLMRNHPEVIISFIAASRTGTVSVPIDPRSKGDMLEYTFSDSESKALIFADYLVDEVRPVLPRVPGLNQVMVLNSRDEGEKNTREFDPLEEILSSGPDEVEYPKVSEADPFEIIYTSGTTGMPKGVVQPNNSFFFRSGLGYFFGYRHDEVLYNGLSLTHGNAQAVTAFPALRMGIPAVFSRKFTKKRLWDITRKYGITSFSLLGGMASGIHNEPSRPDDADNPVRLVVSAGTPRTIFEDFERRFNVKILEWYGTVEGGFTYRPVGRGPAGSFGKARIPGLIDFKIVDKQDEECVPEVMGEIVSQMKIGPTKVEYHGKPEASEKKTRGGWLRSGDIGHYDRNGWLFFDHRKGGELRRHGDFVPTDFVEKVIGEVNEVSEVYLYGVPSSSGAPGESDLVAAVAPVEGMSIDPKKIFERCQKELPPNFVPGYIQVHPEIPKTPSERPKDHLLKTTFDPKAENTYTMENLK
ncbi:MAG: AMP-binding protein [Deltaproteobacteria bacterium]|nr:MAG: AMP-binding protein [Deltaproteobacteria bacterium]